MPSDIEDFLKPEHLYSQYRLGNHIPQSNLVAWSFGPWLTGINEFMPDIVIVGGAVRDTYFDREVKDIDFMTTDGSDVVRLGAYLGAQLLDCLRHKSEDERRKYEQESSMVAAYETEDKSKNLLLVTSIWKRITEFPDSISQCWTDGKNMYATPAFCATAMTKVVNVSSSCSGERLERLKAKYPDFTFASL